MTFHEDTEIKEAALTVKPFFDTGQLFAPKTITFGYYETTSDFEGLEIFILISSHSHLSSRLTIQDLFWSEIKIFKKTLFWRGIVSCWAEVFFLFTFN